MDLREINSDMSIETILNTNNNDDDDDDDHNNNNNKRHKANSGYFYAEVPIGDMEYKRFLYQTTTNSNNNINNTKGRIGTGSVPLQFGREGLAAVLGKPDLAHWKSCVVDKEQELLIASKVRESLTSISDQAI